MILYVYGVVCDVFDVMVEVVDCEFVFVIDNLVVVGM